MIPSMLGLNVGKTKRAISGRKFPKLIARYVPQSFREIVV